MFRVYSVEGLPTPCLFGRVIYVPDKLAEEEFLIHPTHDTGSIWYTILSFFLPVLGIIAAFLFKKFKHTRNYKKCMKGAVTGFAVIGVILLIFLLLLWRVVA